MADEFLYVERFKPKSIDECILPKHVKEAFIKFRDDKQIPHMTLCGSSGVGKTSTIRALATELKFDLMIINGSEEGRLIDTIRNKVKSFASTTSLVSSSKKVLLIDEADNITFDVQKALLGTIEKLQNNCSYILTCNYKNRIEPALRSRCPVFDFTIPNNEKPKIASAFFNRLTVILDNDSIIYDKKILAEYVKKYFPDFRSMLQNLHLYTSHGELTTASITATSSSSVLELMKHMKDNNFREVRKWVTMNLDVEPAHIFRELFEEVPKHLVPSTIPPVILALAEYQYKSAFVMDQEINLVACLIEIMTEAQYA